VTDSVVDVENDKINMLNIKDRYTNNWKEDFDYFSNEKRFVYKCICYCVNHYKRLIIIEN